MNVSDIGISMRVQANEHNHYITELNDEIRRIDEVGGSASDRRMFVVLRDRAVASLNTIANVLAKLS
jgi:hypothetical protein